MTTNAQPQLRADNIDEVLKAMTLEEKAQILVGGGNNSFVGSGAMLGHQEKLVAGAAGITVEIPRLGIPATVLTDGPAGVHIDATRKNDPQTYYATGFPVGTCLASTWNTELVEAVGKAIGNETLEYGCDVILGPGLNIHRNPLCGRNFEYYSEDPVVTGKIGVDMTLGIQSQGVGVSAKHFAVNSQESDRTRVDERLSQRALREIYLRGFERVVRESDPWTIMSSYNMVNGVYANENEHLLQEILRDQWGFRGFVVSDWGACNDFVDGVRAGSHLEMPTTGGDGPEYLKKAMYEGKISEELVDKRVDELLDIVLETHEAVSKYRGQSFDVDAHHAMAERASEESIVLLKNDGNLLPLAPNTKVAVIGDFAETPRYQGAGSSVVNPTKLDSTMGVIGNFPLDVVGFEKGYPRVGAGDAAMQAAAVELAKKADVVLLYLGLDEISESEGLDRSHMKLPQSQIDLLNAVAAVNEKVVIVMSAGSAVEMPWLDKCKAMVHGYLCGQAGASAVLKAILGEINPSGKLSETYPIAYEDVSSAPYFPAEQRSVEYREGLYVGYRYFETVKKPVLFPFGYGLSYTTFAYSDLKVTDKEATFTITNTGKVDGAEVAQLYVSAKAPKIYRPAKELKGFTKVFLKAGESRTVTIPLDDKAFRYFNVKTDRFEIDGGEYDILIGASVADIKLSGTVTVAGTEAELPYALSDLPSYAGADIKKVPDAEFETLLGTPIPDGGWAGVLQMNDAICQLYYARSLKARLVYKIMTGMLNKSIKKGKPDLNIIFIYNMPFRAIGKMAGGMVSQDMCESIVTIVNGHGIAFCKGLIGLIGGFFKQSSVMKHAKAIK